MHASVQVSPRYPTDVCPRARAQLFKDATRLRSLHGIPLEAAISAAHPHRNLARCDAMRSRGGSSGGDGVWTVTESSKRSLQARALLYAHLLRWAGKLPGACVPPAAQRQWAEMVACLLWELWKRSAEARCEYSCRKSTRAAALCAARLSVLRCAQDAIAAERFVQAPGAEAHARGRSLRDALHIAADVADAMAFLHSMDVVHGWLTPGASRLLL